MGKFNGLLAGAIVAGLMAGSIARAQDEGTNPDLSAKPKAKTHGPHKKGKNDCKGKNGCSKDKEAGDKKDTPKKTEGQD